MINLITALRTRLMLIVGRCVVVSVKDTPKMQTVQVRLSADEDRECERVQPYGLSVVPRAGAEGIALAVGGDRSHTIVIAVDDRRYRLTGLAAGEVALYNDVGASVILKADGSIIATPGGTGKVKLGGSILTQALPTEAFATVVCGYLATLTAALPVPCPATPDLIPLGLTTKTEAL